MAAGEQIANTCGGFEHGEHTWGGAGGAASRGLNQRKSRLRRDEVGLSCSRKTGERLQSLRRHRAKRPGQLHRAR